MFKKNKRTVALTALFGALLALGGCSMFGGSSDKAPVVKNTSASSVTFPDRESASFKEGTFVNLDNLRQMIPGLSKAQVYDLIGHPHFNEGVFGVHTWDYIFNFRTGKGNEFMTCQYQLIFNKDMLTEAGNWNRRECADFVYPRPVVAAPAPVVVPVPAPKPAPRKVTLEADTLFAFDKADLNSISPAGRRRLNEISAELRSLNIEHVHVVGHADRLGSAAYNLRLSEQRAATIVQYLVNSGVATKLVSSEGRGSREPVVQCNQRARSDLIACLAPNRRVELEIQGRAGS